MHIRITTVPADGREPDTVRDWSFSHPGTLEVRLSESRDWRYTVARVIRALIEASLCKAAAVPREDIDAFDLGFSGVGEPGNDANAPYHREHVLAELVERQFVSHIGGDWSRYKAGAQAAASTPLS